MTRTRLARAEMSAVLMRRSQLVSNWLAIAATVRAAVAASTGVTVDESRCLAVVVASMFRKASASGCSRPCASMANGTKAYSRLSR